MGIWSNLGKPEEFTGDVTGPGSAVDGNLASFDGITGKVIQDSGIASSEVLTSSSTGSLPGSRLILDENGDIIWSDNCILIDDPLIFAFNVNTSALWTGQKAASGDTFSLDGTADHLGIIRLSVAASSDDAWIGRALNTAAGNPIVVGGGFMRLDFLVNIPTLADVTDDFQLWVGLLRTTAFVTDVGTDAIYFEYNRSSSTNWVGKTRASSTDTTASGGSSVPVDTNWTHLRMDINADGTNVDFYVDGTDIGSSTTNIPSNDMGPELKITKTAGTNARFLDFDHFRYYQKLTNTLWT